LLRPKRFAEIVRGGRQPDAFPNVDEHRQAGWPGAVEHRARTESMLQRIACAMIAGALLVVCCLVALLLGGAISSGRVPPMLAFCAACAAGVFLILGLVMLERRGVPRGVAGFGRH
jgi:hypothetical protein